MVVRSRKKKGGGRKLTYSWGIAIRTTPSGSQQTILDSINNALSAYPSFSPKIKIPAANFTDDLLQVDFHVTLNITNFLSKTRTVVAVIRRENQDLPKLILNEKSIKTRASTRLKIKGECIFLYPVQHN